MSEYLNVLTGDDLKVYLQQWMLQRVFSGSKLNPWSSWYMCTMVCGQSGSALTQAINMTVITKSSFFLEIQ